MPGIARTTTEGVSNNDQFIVQKVAATLSTLTDAPATMEIDTAKLTRLLNLAYCSTTHCCQGRTYDYPYTIYEFDKMDSRLRYVALSRSTKKNILSCFKNRFISFISINYIIDMSDKQEIIKNAYISFGFPGESRLYTLLSKDHKEITKEYIKNVLGHQEAKQIYKPHQNPSKIKQGSITAYTVNALWQMDIFSLFNFVDS